MFINVLLCSEHYSDLSVFVFSIIRLWQIHNLNCPPPLHYPISNQWLTFVPKHYFRHEYKLSGTILMRTDHKFPFSRFLVSWAFKGVLFHWVWVRIFLILVWIQKMFLNYNPHSWFQNVKRFKILRCCACDTIFSCIKIV